MQITYKGQTYEISNTEHSDMYFNAMIRTGVLELIETKPEEKPDHDKAMEIPELMEDDTLEMIREREEYDKSIMEEIPELKEFNYEEYSGKLFDMKLGDLKTLLAISSVNGLKIEELTNSLNAVIRYLKSK